MSSKGSTVTMTSHGITMGLSPGLDLSRSDSYAARSLIKPLSGAYDVKIEFTPGNSASKMRRRLRRSLLVLQQLGLKLEPGKGRWSLWSSITGKAAGKLGRS